MLHEAGHAPVEKKILIQFIKNFRRSRKTPIPKSLAPGPVLGPGLAIFYQAFWDLVAERYSADSPIPWSKVRLWTKEHGLSPEATEDCEYYVRQMDLALLAWKRNNSRRRENKGSDDGNPRSVRSKHEKVRKQRRAESDQDSADGGGGDSD